MERFKKQTNHAKYFIGIFQIRDAGGFVESQPFFLMEALFKPLVNFVQILLRLLYNCFQKNVRV